MSDLLSETELSSPSLVASSDVVAAGKRVLEAESSALASLAAMLDGNFAEAVSLLERCAGTVVVTGMGKSGLVGRKWAATFSSTGTRSYFLNPAEAQHGDLGVVHGSDILVALSWRGETEELAPTLRFAREAKVPVLAVTAVATSSVARQAALVLELPDVEEACPLGLAPTTSTTMMMALGDALAVALMRRRGFEAKDFARLHPGGSLGRRLWLRVEELMHRGDALPVVAPSAPFEEVLVTMTGKRLGLAVVVENRRAIGVITDGDLRRFLQRKDYDGSATAEAMMTRNPKSLGAEALAVEAREIMEAARIQHLIVTDRQGVLVGVVHFHDLLRAKVL
jgi:arabinose-5-phosphate isomerase